MDPAAKSAPTVKKFICLLLIALLLPAGAAAADPAPSPGPGPYNLTIFHTNDAHSAFLPRPASWRDDGKPVGGVIPLAWHLARERRTATADLFLDAGDFMTGNPVCSLEEDGVPGAAVAEMMNRLGYDAGVVGNHEFDLGREDLRRLVARFRFPLLAADIVDGDDVPEFRAEPVVLQRGGLKVGILGVSCAGMEEVVTAGRFAGLRMAPQAETVRRQAAQLDPDTDLLVLITHNGIQDDRALARELEGSGVDVIVGGHSHSRLREPEVEAGILIVQAGSNLTTLGRLDLAVADDRVVRYGGRLVSLWAEGAAADSSLSALVQGYERRVLEEFGREIGKLEVEWRKDRGESNIGNWLADGIRARAGAQVALLNSGSIRKGMDAGPITALDIHEILPFSNTLVHTELSGRELAAIVQRNADSGVSGRHGILQVSGLSYAFRADPDGKRAVVEEILVAGKPLVTDSVYSVAMPDYVAMMAHVYLGIELPELQEVGITMTQAVLDAVTASGPIANRVEGRIRRLD